MSTIDSNGKFGDIAPVPYEDFALVGFMDGRPVMLTSIKPNVLAHTFADQLPCEEDDEDYWSMDRDQVVAAIAEQGGRFEWPLYRTEDAKAVFCAGIKSLPGQQEMFA